MRKKNKEEFLQSRSADDEGTGSLSLRSRARPALRMRGEYEMRSARSGERRR